jgi:hypothetical protein
MTRPEAFATIKAIDDVIEETQRELALQREWRALLDRLTVVRAELIICRAIISAAD